VSPRAQSDLSFSILEDTSLVAEFNAIDHAIIGTTPRFFGSGLPGLIGMAVKKAA
jgi:hypothetical protein